MIFSLNFIVNDPKGLHIYNLVNSFGYDFFEIVKDIVGHEIDITNLDIASSCPSFNDSTYTLDVKSVASIKKIKAFKVHTSITIYVPSGFLGKYWDIQVTRSNPKNIINFTKQLFKKSLRSYDVWFAMNNDAILNDWIDDGCPTYWHCDKDTKKSDNEWCVLFDYKAPISINHIYSYTHRYGYMGFFRKKDANRIIDNALPYASSIYQKALNFNNETK